MQEINCVLSSFENLTGLNKEIYKVIDNKKDVLINWKDDLINSFYNHLFSFSKTAQIPKEGERAGLEKTLSDWYIDIINGNLDEKFWRKQWYVGLAHIHRGVDNSYMIAMMNLLQSEFAKKCFSNFEHQEALEISLAFNKITDAIISIIIEGYLSLYMESIERMAGIKKTVIQRMASLESKKMFEEYKKSQ